MRGKRTLPDSLGFPQKWVTAHLVNNGKLNPYFQGSRDSVTDLDFLFVPKTSYHMFPTYGQGKTTRRGDAYLKVAFHYRLI